MLGKFNADGSWTSFTEKFRSLSADEVADLRHMAETTTPSFENEHPEGHPKHANAKWENHHPIAQEIWEKRGLKPK